MQNVQEANECYTYKNEAAQVSQTSVREDMRSTVISSITLWVGVMKVIVGFLKVWRKIGTPCFRIRRKRELKNQRNKCLLRVNARALKPTFSDIEEPSEVDEAPTEGRFTLLTGGKSFVLETKINTGILEVSNLCSHPV